MDGQQQQQHTKRTGHFFPLIFVHLVSLFLGDTPHLFPCGLILIRLFSLSKVTKEKARLRFYT